MIKKAYYYFTPAMEIVKYPGIKDYSTLRCFRSGENHYNSATYTMNATTEEIICAFNGTVSFRDAVQAFHNKYGDPITEIESKIKVVFDFIESSTPFSIGYNLNPESHEIRFTEHKTVYPTNASIELTTRCNMECRHCYGSYGGEKNRLVNEMSLDDVRRLFHDLHSIGVTYVELTGGEITTHPHIVEIVEEAFNSGMQIVNLLTNGAMLSDSLFDVIIQHKQNLIMQIDLHSLNPQYHEWFTGLSNSLEKIKINIKRLTHAGIIVTIGSIITPQNVAEVDSLSEWAYINRAKAIAFSPVVSLGRAAAQYTENDGDNNLVFQSEEEAVKFGESLIHLSAEYPGFIRETKPTDGILRKNCGLVHSQITITPSGNIKLCVMDNKELFDFSLGNVFAKPVKAILDSHSELVDILVNLIPPSSDNVCVNCPHFLFCSGCIYRGLVKAFQIGSDCTWYNALPDKLRSHILPVEEQYYD